ncbi:MAG: HK97 gp10 family phage protein [Clostridia bacterium]|nr:HK97 gp10 family phage protein [Clostridia bacterium]
MFHYEMDPTRSIEAFLNRLDRVDERTENAAAAAVEAAGDTITEKQRQLCPVRTGKLKSKIHRGKAYKNKSGNYTVRCGLDFKRDPDVRGAAVSAEFGRDGGTNRRGQTVPPQRATPFIRPGADAAREEAARRMEDVFFREVGLNE